MTAIRAGQEYAACHPLNSIRIRVIHAGPFDGDRAMVATIHLHPLDGREFLDRRRLIKAAQLHDDPNRRSGYRLVKDAAVTS